MEIVATILAFALVAFAAACEAIMDKVQFHYFNSIFSDTNTYNQLFWNPNESWKNKWASDLKTERFPGSSTIFVFTTDAWHLFKFFNHTAVFIGLPLLAFGSLNVVLAVILARITYGLVFTLFFDHILVKK
jgi:hypothetical protein